MDWSEGGPGNYLRGCSVTTLFFHETRWSRTLPGRKKTGRGQKTNITICRCSFKKLPSHGVFTCSRFATVIYAHCQNFFTHLGRHTTVRSHREEAWVNTGSHDLRSKDRGAYTVVVDFFFSIFTMCTMFLLTLTKRFTSKPKP